jgi:DNA-binding transcriptional regulator YiaG
MTASQIRAIRKPLCLSSEDFAVELGFGGEHARITIWRWETRRRKPVPQTIALMRQLADKLGL